MLDYIAKIAKRILKISRPKFWMYLAGPYLIAYIATMPSTSNIFSLTFVLHFLFFLVPANIFLYGINDYFDRDTDKLNPKKGSDEVLINDKDTQILQIILWLNTALFFIAALLQPNLLSTILLAIFYLLSAGYSMPPFRFKAKPAIDSLSNILYAFPAFIAIAQNTNTPPVTTVIIIGLFWNTAMHLFSAIPDIEPDQKAGLATTAVTFGRTTSLVITFTLWLIVAIQIFITGNTFPLSLLAFIYPLIPLTLLLRPKINIEKVYKTFPYINFTLGMVITLWVILQRFF